MSQSSDRQTWEWAFWAFRAIDDFYSSLTWRIVTNSWMFRRSSQFFDENWRVLFSEWFSACDRWFSCKASNRANLVTNHRRRSLRVFLIATLHCSFQNDLTCRLRIVHDTIISTIDRRNFDISFMQKSISRTVIENCNVIACFIVFLILFKSMSFHVLRAIRERFDFVSQRIFVEMKMWFDDWSRSERVMQCFNLFVKWVDMNVKFMMLIELRAFHVIESFDKIKVRLRFCIMSSKSFVTTCCVERNESLQKKWWRLKFFNNMWWSSNVSTMNRMIFDNVNELSFDVYEMNDELHTLCMQIIFVSFSISLTIILSTLRSIVKYSIFQFSMFIWSLT
jgi:hypothetical protein